MTVRTWLVALARWVVRDLGDLIAVIIVLGSALLLIDWASRHDPPMLENVFRWLGGGFQGLGILIVIHDLIGKGRLFGLDSIIPSFRDRFSRFPRLRRRAISGAAFANTSGVQGKVSGTVSHIPKTRSLGERVELLEAQQRELEQRLAKQSQLSLSKIEEAKRISRRDTVELTKAQSATQQLLREVSTRDIHISFFGVLAVLLGLLLSTLSPELAGLFVR